MGKGEIFVMRDAGRIPRMTTLLEKIWEYQPDVRFNQLVSNLQSQYSQQHDHYGERVIDSERGTYLDMFFLEDDKWERFLESYSGEIEEGLKKREAEITNDVINQVIELFLEAGLKEKEFDEDLKERIRMFYNVESKWLTIEAITNMIRRFSLEERQELFHKIKKSLC